MVSMFGAWPIQQKKLKFFSLVVRGKFCRSEYLFNFDQPFEIHDDIEVLKRLGLAHGLERAEVPVDQRAKVKACLPPALREYVDQILEGTFEWFFDILLFFLSFSVLP